MSKMVIVLADDLRLLMEQATALDEGERVPLNEALARCGEALNGTGEALPFAAATIPEPGSTPSAAAAPVHLGEYARVDIMGHDWRVGWVSDGSMAGAACLDVRDDSGRLVAKIPPHTVYLYSPLDPPRPGEVRAALPAGDEGDDGLWDVSSNEGDDGEPF